MSNKYVQRVQMRIHVIYLIVNRLLNSFQDFQVVRNVILWRETEVKITKDS